jgi:hypothetical protein
MRLYVCVCVCVCVCVYVCVDDTYKTNKGSYPSKRVDPSLSRALSLYVSIRPLQTQSH